MSRSRTPQALRTLANDVADTYACPASAEHEGGGRWLMQWRDGPTADQMRARAAQAAPGVEVDLRRNYSPRAWSLAGLRTCLAGQVGHGADGAALSWQLEGVLEESEAPETVGKAEDGRLGVLAEALLAQAEDTQLEHRLLDPLARRGVAHLLKPRQASLDTTDVLTMAPAEHLTDLYAKGEDTRAWRMRLRTLPAADLVAAAGADAELDQTGRLAVLGLLEELRRLWEGTEASAFAAARDAAAPGGSASWSQIGAVLGISRQGAQDRGKRRAAGGPSRLA